MVTTKVSQSYFICVKPSVVTCICRDTGMCHYFGHIFGDASGFLGIFLDCSLILGHHFLGKIYLFRNHSDFWVLIWIFN